VRRDPDNGAIAKSTNQGSTWTLSNLTFKVGGNMPGRGTGERLAVDPANSDIVYFGARSGNGLWKSTDGGTTFSNVTSFKNTGTYREDPSDSTGYESDLMGLLFVTFDSTSSTIGGATSRIFVGVADNVTASVYESTDAGSTWSPLAGQPGAFFPHKCKLQPTEKALYFTYSDGIGPYDGTDGAVWRYDLTASTWTDITPVSGSDLYFGFGGLGVDMLKPGYLVVAALNSWWPNAQIFRSNDSGASWSPLWEWTSYPSMDLYYGLSVSPKLSKRQSSRLSYWASVK
jgi:xyloglucan-specific exo-beta-1,4-glucanase